MSKRVGSTRHAAVVVRLWLCWLFAPKPRRLLSADAHWEARNAGRARDAERTATEMATGGGRLTVSVAPIAAPIAMGSRAWQTAHGARQAVHSGGAQWWWPAVSSAATAVVHT
jgi:hypothetical protein